MNRRDLLKTTSGAALGAAMLPFLKSTAFCTDRRHRGCGDWQYDQQP